MEKLSVKVVFFPVCDPSPKTLSFSPTVSVHSASHLVRVRASISRSFARKREKTIFQFLDKFSTPSRDPFSMKLCKHVIPTLNSLSLELQPLSMILMDHFDPRQLVHEPFCAVAHFSTVAETTHPQTLIAWTPEY